MKTKKELTERQKKVFDVGKKAEKKVVKWLEQHGYKILYTHKSKASARPYDIKASKGKEKVIIEVKTGTSPKIKITSFEKMLREKGFNKIWLALVSKNFIHLLEYNKRSFAAVKARETRRRRKAAREAVHSRRLK